MNIIKIRQINHSLPHWINEVRKMVLKREHTYFEAREFVKRDQDTCTFTTLIPSAGNLGKNIDLLEVKSYENIIKTYAIIGDGAVEIPFEEYKKEKSRVEELEELEKLDLDIASIQALFEQTTFSPETIDKLILLKHIILSESNDFIFNYYKYYDSLNEMRNSRLKALRFR